MISKSPRYANVITFGLPLFIIVLSLLLWVFPPTRNGGTSALAILFASWFVFVGLIINAILSQLAGVIATSKGRRFGPFYFIGLFASFLGPLIVAARSKPKA